MTSQALLENCFVKGAESMDNKVCPPPLPQAAAGISSLQQNIHLQYSLK